MHHDSQQLANENCAQVCLLCAHLQEPARKHHHAEGDVLIVLLGAHESGPQATNRHREEECPQAATHAKVPACSA